MRDKNQRVAGREENIEKTEVGEGLPLANFRKFPENDERYINFSPKEDHAIFPDDQCHGKPWHVHKLERIEHATVYD